MISIYLTKNFKTDIDALKVSKVLNIIDVRFLEHIDLKTHWVIVNT